MSVALIIGFIMNNAITLYKGTTYAPINMFFLLFSKMAWLLLYVTVKQKTSGHFDQTIEMVFYRGEHISINMLVIKAKMKEEDSESTINHHRSSRKIGR